MKRPKRHRRSRKACITERKLGRHHAIGVYYPGTRFIELDPRLMSKTYLRTCIHELLHYTVPELSETRVIKASSIIAQGVWERNFRRLMK